MDTIEIHGLEVWARHGVLDQESRVGNLFSVDVTLGLNLAKAMESDDVADTVNYARVVEIINREMVIQSRLLEHVVGRIKNAIISEFPQVLSGHLKITKIKPPIPGIVGAVAVSTTW